MITRMGLIQKRADWSAQQFRSHWLEHHGPLAARLPGLRRYQQHHVIDSVQRGISYERGPEQLDGFSELWFDSKETMRAAIQSNAGLALIPDEKYFMGNLRIIGVEQVEVVAPEFHRPMIKRMSLLRRRADVAPDQFLHEWHEVHARLVKSMPGVRGYRQNFVTERQSPKGTTVDYDALPIDGIVELWFDSNESLDTAFNSPQGQATMAHARTFIAEITTFLVETHIIV
jgi:uncharacterized protein (TIGR02118 family)